MGVAHRIRAPSIGARREQRIDVIKDESMHVPDEPLIDRHLALCCDLVDEAERLPRRQHLERVFSRKRRSGTRENVLDLERVQAVPFDPRCSVDRSNPRAMPEPLRVLRIKRQVLEDLTPSLQLIDAVLQRAPRQAVLHVPSPWENQGDYTRNGTNAAFVPQRPD
ncbi:MAG: hypothetical protein E6J52_05145 [Chloroflexi bacterium]|nr:MAG: hypothetical protein E6J52_05145 [Chloroflexota bacterium]